MLITFYFFLSFHLQIICNNAKLRIFCNLAIGHCSVYGDDKCDKCLLCSAAFLKYEAYKFKRLDITSLKFLKLKENHLILTDFDFGCKLILLRCSFVFCNEKIKKLQRCKGCKFNIYCCRSCQKRDWKFIHSKMCERSNISTFCN